MKQLIVLCSLCGFVLTGCANIPKMIDALAKDPAAARVTIVTVQGTIIAERAVPSTNLLSITKDGITTGK